MKLSKSLLNRQVTYRGFDDVIYEGYIDAIRFPDQCNTGIISIGYFVPQAQQFCTARLDRRQFNERCTLV